jgi:hypothetical protein
VNSIVIWPDGSREWRDEQGRRHRVDGPAVIWSDGTQEWWREGRLHRDGDPAIVYPDHRPPEYYLRGERVRDDWGKVPTEHWRMAWMSQTNNQEERRLLLQVLGTERVAAYFHGQGKVIHQAGDMALYEITVPGAPRPWRVLSVKCPSTGRPYLLRVPPTMRDCEEARRWTFGMDNTERFDQEA